MGFNKKEYAKKWYGKNRAYSILKAKEWQRKNPERKKETDKRFNERHPNYKKEQNQREDIKKAKKEWWLRNPDYIKNYLKIHNKKPEVRERNSINYKIWKKNNPLKLEEIEKRFKKKNLDYMKNYHAINSKKIKKRHKKWYEKNRAKLLKKQSLNYLKKRDKENKRRKKLGLPLVGEGFTNEMELLVYVHNLFQDYNILTHHRKTLNGWGRNGLELDIYIPKLKLAFEYMGEQHYNERSYYMLTNWKGGDEDFEYQQYKDRCKKTMCKLKGITLIRIKYNEKLSEQLVLSKMKYSKIRTNQQLLNLVGGKNGT